MNRTTAPIQASRWEAMTAVLGVALIALFFAPWYSQVDGAYFNRSVSSSSVALGGRFDLSGWDGSTVTSVIVAVFGAAALVQVLVLRSTRSSGVAIGWNVGMTWAAIVVVVWILVRLLFPPAGLDAAWAGWVSLAVALAMLTTGWLGMRDERTVRTTPSDVPLRPIPPPSA